MIHTQKSQSFQLLLSMLLLFSFFSTTAQTKEKVLSKFYLQSGAGSTSNEGISGEISLQAIFKNKWSVTISNQEINMKHGNIPADYKPASSTTYLLFIPISNTYEVEPMNMNLFSITAGRCLNITKNCWITAEAGVSYLKGEKAIFTPTPVTRDSYDYWLIFGSSTSSNYITTIENKTAVGAMLKADINLIFIPFMGLSTGMFANFNSIRSPVGFQAKLIIGKMGAEKNKRKNTKRK